MHTLLPEPVSPAISRWGICVRSATMGAPPLSLPSARGNCSDSLANSFVPRTSRRYTVARC